MTGFVLVDKPRGPTSHDIVDRARRAFEVKRVGHAGTLDPGATGLLVLAVGPATRLLRYVQGLVKTYDVTGVLGVRTTTLDADGEVVSREQVSIAPAAIKAAASGFLGEISQRPPAVSAINIDGERAYKRVARGEEVELQPRNVTIHSFDVLRAGPDAFDARVVCSTGTYIRSLVADLGDALGVGAHVAHLRRIAIGELNVREAVRADRLDRLGRACLRSVEDTLAHLPRVDVDEQTAALARNGRPIEAPAADGDVLVVGPGGAVGVFVARDGILRPSTVLGTAS